MNATCLDNNGKSVIMPMGCYGIGVTRIVAAAIEQNHDARGIVWPESMAPFQLVITPIGYNKSEQVTELCNELYDTFSTMGVEVLLDDRKERPGIMFADADLLGIPHRIVIGEKSLAKGEIEYKYRRAESSEDIAKDGIVEFIKSALNKA